MSCITLLSDLGLQDASVASAKGILMQVAGQLPVLDISHQVEAFHIQQAAYLLAAAYKSFPPGSFHIILCNIFSESQPKLVLGQKEGHYFLAPDNGVLPLALGKIDSVFLCAQLSATGSFREWVAGCGDVINNMSTGSNSYQAYELKNIPGSNWKPKVDGLAVECQVIHIDRFENVVLNITREQFTAIGRNRPFKLQLMRDEVVTTISTRYDDVPVGQKLCRFNNAGYLEIAINQGKAASLFGFRLYREQHLIYTTIKIFFE